MGAAGLSLWPNLTQIGESKPVNFSHTSGSLSHSQKHSVTTNICTYKWIFWTYKTDGFQMARADIWKHGPKCHILPLIDAHRSQWLHREFYTQIEGKVWL